MARSSAGAALLIFLVGVWFSCETEAAAGKRVKRIVNGFPAKSVDFPYQVLVRKQINETAYTCGGSIISDSWVLTAAHCFNSSFQVGDEQVYVMTGTDASKNTSARTIDVEQVIAHPDFETASFTNDIALLKLRTKFKWSEDVKHVEVADANFLLEGTAVIPGWGRKTPSGNTSSTLQAAKVSLLPNDVCQTIFEQLPKDSHLKFVPETSTCVLTVHTGICQGDSGSPLVLRGKQVGVASASTTVCTPPFFSVYTRVSSYLNWINSTCENCLTTSKQDPAKRASMFSPEVSSAPQHQKPTSQDLKHRVIITVTAVALPPNKVKLQDSCSGSIIAKSWVLTSALCLDVTSTSTPVFWVIPAAEFKESGNASWIQVRQTYIDGANDKLAVALLETEVEFQWSETVGPVAINGEFDDSAETVKLLVSLEVAGSPSEDRLANVTTGTLEDYRLITKRLDQDPEDILYGSLENLSGDRLIWKAGSSIVDSRGHLVALAVENLNSTIPLILTKRVSAYIDWVRETCGCLEMTREEILTRFTRVSIAVVLLLMILAHFIYVRFGVQILGRYNR